jgi:F0F1-type ATP synthase assembly protein I
MRDLAMALELPFVMIGGVLIGGGLGYLADRAMHTSPAFILIGGFLGFGAGIWDIIKRLSRQEKQGKSNGG